MKDQYFGDISDYRKYGILRSLAGVGALNLLVCWMLTEDDGSADGKRTGYLFDPEKWRKYDPELFDVIAQNVLHEKVRRVSIIEENELIQNAQYYSARLGDSPGQRKSFIEGLRPVAEEADLVFFDPDNGLEVNSVKYGRKNSSKYLYWREVEEIYKLGPSLLIYQHYNRTKRDVFIRNLAVDLLNLTGAEQVISLRTSHTAFFLAVQESHRDAIEKSVTAIDRQWNKQITSARHTI